MKIYFVFICLFLLTRCGHKNNVSQTYSNSKLEYYYDTTYQSYKGDFTKQYVGGIDLHFKDSTTYIVFNFCGHHQLKIIDYFSDSLLELVLYNSTFQEVYTDIKKNDIYVLTVDGKVWQYCKGSINNELIFDLMSDSIFKKSGLVVNESKPGGDQHINIPENMMYFRLRQDYENMAGTYSKLDCDYPNFGKYNLQTNKIEFFGKEPHFSIYQEYGLVSNLYDLFIGDSIITSNGYNGLIQIINTLNNKIRVIKAKSNFDVKPIKKWRYHSWMKDAKNKKMQHWLQSPNYESLFYNPYTKKYYRIFHPRMEKLNADGLLNTDQDKQSVLMVFDEKLKLIDEILLPIKRLQVLKLIPIKDGVSIFIPELYKIDSFQKTYGFFNIHHN